MSETFWVETAPVTNFVTPRLTPCSTSGRPASRRRDRASRDHWWFEQMRGAVNGARDWEAALEHAQQSWSLYRSRRAARAACLAAAALGETREALSWRRRGQD